METDNQKPIKLERIKFITKDQEKLFGVIEHIFSYMCMKSINELKRELIIEIDSFKNEITKEDADKEYKS
jgi:hypothetical protein